MRSSLMRTISKGAELRRKPSIGNKVCNTVIDYCSTRAYLPLLATLVYCLRYPFN
jgi:hypothetical protein